VRRLLVVVALVFIALVVGVSVALSVIDAERLREPIVSRVSEGLGRSVELGEIELGLFPMPGVRVREVVVAGSAPEAPPLLEVAELHLRVALLPLLLGRVMLRTVELGAPRVHLELDAAGRPRLPVLGASQAAGRGPTKGAAEEGSPPILAVDTIWIHEGALEAGPWQLENLELRGLLRLDRSAELAFEADLAGVGGLRDGRLELEGVGTDALSALGNGRLEAIDLAGLGERLGLEPELAGRVDGTFELGVREGVAHDGFVKLRAGGLAVASGSFELEGEVDLAAELGGTWRIDLTRSRIDLGETLSKPVGLAASITGELGPSATLGAFRDAVLELGATRLELTLALDAVAPILRIEPARLELEPLGALLRAAERSLAGSVELGAWHLQLDPPALAGNATLNGVALEPLLTALLGESQLLGRLDAKVRLEGPLDATALEGTGQLEITEGRIRGFSLLRQVLGDLSALPLLVAQLKGKDLSRYEEEEFRRLATDFRLRRGRLYLDDLILEYRHATAQLHGSVGVRDGSLDLAGRLVIAREVDAALGNQGESREKVIPISGIGGSVSRPRVRLDRAALLELAAAYAIQGRMGEKLKEKLGDEGFGALDGFLDQILRRGGRER